MIEPAGKRVLHVGCGFPAPGKLNPVFDGDGWREVRLDIDPDVEPDIVGSITDLSAVPDGWADAIWSSHNIEHIHDHEVPLALAEFRRVLRPDGFVLITCPDLDLAARMLVDLGPEKTIMVTGDERLPVTPLDIIFGGRIQVARGRTYMAHRIGFTAETLGTAIARAGFGDVHVRRGNMIDLWALAWRSGPIRDPDLLSRAVSAPVIYQG